MLPREWATVDQRGRESRGGLDLQRSGDEVWQPNRMKNQAVLGPVSAEWVLEEITG
jgi:hypothetical protein